MLQSNSKSVILLTGVEREHHFTVNFHTEINVLTTGVEREHQFSVILHAETLLLTMGAEREHQCRFILHIKINVLSTGVEREHQYRNYYFSVFVCQTDFLFNGFENLLVDFIFRISIENYQAPC